MKGFKKITFDPNIMGGQACIRGMRIPVSLIVNLVANGMKIDDIIKEIDRIQKHDPDPDRTTAHMVDRKIREWFGRSGGLGY